MSYGREFKVKLRSECQLQIHYSLKKLHINIYCVLPEEFKVIKSGITHPH